MPSGVSLLMETYDDWRVACEVDQAETLCTMSQQQWRQDGRRVIAIELQPAPDDVLSGAIVMPFGLELEAGAVLRIDEQPILSSLRFHTCLPAGCLVRVRFDAATVAQLRAGARLYVQTHAADTGGEFEIDISLNGFSSAALRLTTLTGS